LEFPFNISATTEDSDFKFGVPLGLATVHHKITPSGKEGVPLARGAPQICGFPFDISAMTEGSDFNIGGLVGFAKAHHKIPSRRKRGHGPGLGELPKIWGSPFNIYARAESIDFKFGTQFGWPIRPIMKSHK